MVNPTLNFVKLMEEIERKFLVKNTDFVKQSSHCYAIAQGYLNTAPERNVRVRIKGDKGFLTVKGLGNDSGVRRFEWEKEISIDDAKKLLVLCEPTVIEKTRYEVPVGSHIFEVDVFEGAHKGLTIAEIELAHEDEVFEKPSWLGQEVTGNIEYYNSYLSKKA